MDFFGHIIKKSEEDKAIDNVLMGIQRLIDSHHYMFKMRCSSCSGMKSCKVKGTPLKPKGRGGKKILVLESEYPFSGLRLTNTFSDLGIDIDRDCWRIPVCRSEKTPTPPMIESCRYYVFKAIRELNPEKIIAVGSLAVKSLVAHRAGSRVATGNIDSWVGWVIPDQELNAFVSPVYDPMWIDKQGFSTGYEVLNEKNLKKAFTHKAEFKVLDYKSCCKYTEDMKEVISFIAMVRRNQSTIVFDFETTGKKPHSPVHEILYASICDGNISLGFPFFKEVVFLEAWKGLMLDPKVKKVAQNFKYEENWSCVILGYRVVGWVYDTMLAMHIIDNRDRITGLKFQGYVWCGVIGYDKISGAYIDATFPGDNPDSSNSRNMLKYAPAYDVGMYCAVDSFLTHKTMTLQVSRLDRGRLRALRLFMNSSLSFSKMETFGMRVDYSQLHDVRTKIEGFIDECQYQISQIPEVLGWEDDRGRKFDFNSTDDLQDFVYVYMNEGATKKTRGGGLSVDKDVMISLAKVGNSAVYGYIQDYRRWTKALEYITGIEREAVDGIIHCNLNLGGVSSYRTSASDINLQNVPKRDKEVMLLIRGVFFPRSRHKIKEFDFKAFEVSIYACYSKDPALIEYVSDLSKDMHRDMGAYILKLTVDEMYETFETAKRFRQETKSGFVFSQLFGAGYKTCALYFWDFFQTKEGAIFWENFSQRTGIITYTEWENWIEEVTHYFWHVKFPKLGEWREKNWNDYLRLGEVFYFTGFRAGGVLGKPQVTNFPVQGTASHVKLAVLNLLIEKLEKDNADSKVFLEVHDSVLVDAAPWEDDYLRDVMRWIVNVKIPEMFPWVIVPLYLEEAEAQVNEPWSKVKEIGIINRRVS